MAQKFVRGVTGVDDIEKLDKSLTNVNDLISDGQNTYVHTIKGKDEFYYKVTDGVTSVNSTGDTITVEKSDDGTLKLDTNPLKVLEHNNLLVDSNLKKVHSNGDSTTTLKLSDDFVSTVNGKQNTITNSPSIAVVNSALRQLYTGNIIYKDDNGILKTHVKIMADSTLIYTVRQDFNFIVKINKGAKSINFILTGNDIAAFRSIINNYGLNNSVIISGCTFTLSGSTLTVTTANNIDNNYVITFSDII